MGQAQKEEAAFQAKNLIGWPSKRAGGTASWHQGYSDCSHSVLYLRAGVRTPSIDTMLSRVSTSPPDHSEWQ